MTFKRAAKELGADERQVVEIDILRGGKWDMLDDKLFSDLLFMALDGQLSAILGSPNCRTRSRLRHQEREGLPGPARHWNGGEWGSDAISAAEKKKCHQDDTMLLRMVMLFVVAEEVRRATKKGQPVTFLLEHPSAPGDLPEVVSWWRLPQWHALKKAYGLGELHLNQEDWGGYGSKPTTLGTNMQLGNGGMNSRRARRGRPSNEQRMQMTNEEIVQGSKRLARWTPRLMLAIAEGVLRSMQQPVQPRLCSWKTHVQRDHYPFRKDCQVCQEAAARGAPHYKQKLPPRAGVLFLDITGPFKTVSDLEKGTKVKYILAGAITWPAGGIGPDVEAAEEPVPADEAPALDELEEVDGPRRGRPRHRRADDDSEDAGSEKEVDADIIDDREEDDHPAPLPSQGEDQEEAQVAVHRVAVPLESRAQGVVLKAIIDITLMLKAEGMTVTQLHTDRGGEFRSKRLRNWCRERHVIQTWTAGDEPQSNGRAEKSRAGYEATSPNLASCRRSGGGMVGHRDQEHQREVAPGSNGQERPHTSFLQPGPYQEAVLAGERLGAGPGAGALPEPFVGPSWALDSSPRQHAGAHPGGDGVHSSAYL